MKNYNDFQIAATSEKVLLCVLNATKRLQGFELVSGINYRIARNSSVIAGLKLNGESIEYSFDDEYIYITSSLDPNSRNQYYVLEQKLFFSDKGVSLPHDLDSGFEVYFEPSIKSSSSFGVELDTTNQGLSAIEGSGNISFYINDFWKTNFDKINLDNQYIQLYSWSPSLKANQAKLIFNGIVESKSYKSDSVSLNLKDLLYRLRTTFELKDISELEMRNNPNLDTAKQRIVYGKVKGHLPVNVDSLLNNSYPLTGTVALFNGSPQVIGTNTTFKSKLVPQDKLIINGSTYTVQNILSDTNLTITANYSGVNTTTTYEVSPVIGKNYINRKWLVSGHALNEPETVIRAGSTTQLLFVDSTTDFYANDVLCIDTGSSTELVKIREVLNDNTISLSQTTNIVYPDGTRIFRPCVQNVKMDDVSLTYLEDYTIDKSTGLLLLNENAEKNRAQTLESSERISISNGDNKMIGNETKFTSYLKSGYYVRPQGTEEWYQILELSDNEITLTETYTGIDFITNESLPEKTSISGLDDYKALWKFYFYGSAIELQGKYFKIQDSNGSVAIWFDINNVGTEEPAHGCDRSIEITTIDSVNNSNTVMQKIMQKLNLDDSFECYISNGELYIKSKLIGVRPVASSSVGNDFVVFNRTYNEQLLTLTGDVADSLDMTGFYLQDATGLVFFWYAVDNNLGATEPSNDGYRSVKITTVNTDDSVSTVRSKTKAVIDVEGFSSTNQSTNQLVVSGSMSSINIGTVTSGTISTVNNGKSAWNLNSKYFIIPYYDGTALFWFNVDGQGVAPLVSADITSEITLDSSLEEDEIFSAITDVLEGITYFDVESTDNSILITDINSETLSNTLSSGTSGLNIQQAQQGVSVNPESGAILQYKNYVFNSDSVLSLDVYGKSNSEGKLIQTAPEIVQDILEIAGMSDFIDFENFEQANDYFIEQMSFCIPEKYNDKSVNLTFRDVINKVNSSVLGILLQDNNFLLQYAPLKPSSKNLNYFDETDILNFSIETTNKNTVQTSICEYNFKEWDSAVKDKSNLSVSKSSLNAEYISGITGSRTFESYLVNESDAQRLANRWSFLLEQSSGTVTLQMKLNGVQLQVGSVIHVKHEKFFDRFGGQSKNKLLMVESIKKSSRDVEVTCIDLSNAFNRVAKITDNTLSFDESNDETRLLGGYYTDSNGSINNNPESFNINLIW